MMRSQSGGRTPESNPAQRDRGLLATRFLNSLPYASSVKDYYLRKKQANELLRIGLNLTENIVSSVSSPFVKRYTVIDQFASTQLEKLEKISIRSTAETVAYPIGYTIGLAEYTRDTMVGLASPVVEKSYEFADMLIDNLMPPETDETLEEEYRRMPVLRQKNPIRIVKKRTTFKSVMNLPINAMILGRDMAFSTIYISLGFSSMIVGRLLHSMESLINSVNAKAGLEELVTHPYTFLSRQEVSRLYESMQYHGGEYVIDMLDVVIERANKLSVQLERRNLPHNATVPAFFARKLKNFKRRLAKYAKIQLNKEDREVPLRRRAFTPRRLTPTRTPTHRIADRMPTMVLGENTFDQHKMELEAQRMPTILYGASAARPTAHSAERTPKRTPMKARETPEASAKKEWGAREAKEWHGETQKMKEAPEQARPSDVDEYGYSTVKPKHHGHALPLGLAKQLATQILTNAPQSNTDTNGDTLSVLPQAIPPTPANSPAFALAPNNPYASILVEDQETVDGPFAETRREREGARGHVRPHVYVSHSGTSHDPKHRNKKPRQEPHLPTQAQVKPWEAPLVSKPRVGRLAPQGMLAPAKKHDERGMAERRTSQAEKQDRERIEREEAEEEIQRRALAELEQERKETELKEEKEHEKEAAAEKEKESWEVPKHPIHIVVEEPAPEPKPDEIPAPENNPFAKLAEVDPFLFPSAVGNPSM